MLGCDEHMEAKQSSASTKEEDKRRFRDGGFGCGAEAARFFYGTVKTSIDTDEDDCVHRGLLLLAPGGSSILFELRRLHSLHLRGHTTRLRSLLRRNFRDLLTQCRLHAELGDCCKGRRVDLRSR